MALAYARTYGRYRQDQRIGFHRGGVAQGCGKDRYLEDIWGEMASGL